jgi:mercuric ion transport protein
VLRVELVFDRDCPNVARARAVIRAALGEVGADAVWSEWDRADAATPAELRSYGSPSVLVNGKDVDANEVVRSDANSCRVYMDDCGCVCGAPSAWLIVRAIRLAQAA